MMITEKELQTRKIRIIHTAFLLFCKRGIDGVTIADIAKASHVSETSIYRYFSTKAELMSHAQEVLWLEIVDDFSSSLRQVSDYELKSGLEQIAVLLNGFYQLFHNHAEYVVFSYDYRLFLIRHNLKMGTEEYDGVLKSVHALFVAALKKGKLDGSVLTLESEDDLYYAIWGLMRGFVAKIVIYDRMYDGENPWGGRFNLVCSMILSSLKNGVTLLEYPL